MLRRQPPPRRHRAESAVRVHAVREPRMDVVVLLTAGAAAVQPRVTPSAVPPSGVREAILRNLPESQRSTWLRAN